MAEALLTLDQHPNTEPLQAHHRTGGALRGWGAAGNSPVPLAVGGQAAGVPRGVLVPAGAAQEWRRGSSCDRC